jgi:hypothetical protein
MDRLMFVRDTCHILKNPCFSWRSTTWYKTGMKGSVIELANGYTNTVISSRILTWRRHYTRDGNPPQHPTPTINSLIILDEWVPGIWPLKKDRASWTCMGNGSCHGIFYLSPAEDVTKTWSSHAKRHLKTFLKSGCTVRDGNFEDIETDMLRSQVPKTMSIALSRIVAHRLSVDPETMNIFVAEDANGKRIGCFACANDEETKESMYIMGYFLPEAGKLQPMTGLVHLWLTRLQEQGWRSGNFGLMLGPHIGRLDPWWGLSNFKTHFGITRVHLPPGYWKISSSLLRKNKTPT